MAATLLHTEVNGVQVPIIFEKDNRLPLTTVEFIFRESGALASSKAGLVSLAANLLNEGTKKEGTAKFAKELENRAITFSANSGKETFVFTLETIKEQLPFGIEKLKELLQDPNYTDETFNKIRKKRIATLIKKGDDFDYIAANGLKSLLFENSNMALPQLGTKESIKSLTLNDIKSFINNHFFLNNLIVVAAGDFNEDDIKKSLPKLLLYLKKELSLQYKK